MFSGVSIFLVFTEIYLHTSQLRGLHFTCSHTTKIMEIIAFWRLSKFREGGYFLFCSKLLVNNVSLDLMLKSNT